MTCGADRSIRAWDVIAGKALRTFAGAVSDLTSVAVDPDGALAVTGAADGSLRLWSVGTGEQLFHQSFKTTVLDVAFSPDGKRIASAHREDAVRLWDARAREQVRVLRPSPG